jgi:nucleoside-diphosphate-sugar epimerase
MKLAITGGTGFVGAHVIDAALVGGHQVTALTRRAQPAREGLTWIAGDLADRAALDGLVAGADAIIHVAGVLKARDAAAFELGNVEGTKLLLAAAQAADTRRFILVSSLAAREPRLSLYGASKAKAEGLVEQSGLDWTIVRPPAVYGPGDRETLDLFKMARGGQIFMPPAGRLSLIHVDDLAALLLALAAPDGPTGLLLEPDDGREGGWTHREFGDALGEAVGMPARTVSTPRLLLSIAARLDRLFRGDKARLTPDRVAYFCHPDWVASRDRAIPPEVWHAKIPTSAGLKQTAEWYCAQGWL